MFDVVFLFKKIQYIQGKTNAFVTSASDWVKKKSITRPCRSVVWPTFAIGTLSELPNSSFTFLTTNNQPKQKQNEERGIWS